MSRQRSKKRLQKSSPEVRGGVPKLSRREREDHPIHKRLVAGSTRRGRMAEYLNLYKKHINLGTVSKTVAGNEKECFIQTLFSFLGILILSKETNLK